MYYVFDIDINEILESMQGAPPKPKRAQTKAENKQAQTIGANKCAIEQAQTEAMQRLNGHDQVGDWCK
jgi:hypothetical protein